MSIINRYNGSHLLNNNFQGADGRNVLLTDEIEAIRTGLQQLNTNQNLTSKEICIPQVESVPEELFRRYL